MPRPKADTVQTAVRLPREMHERLKGGRGVSEEIRSRVERTLAEDADPATRELVAGILSLAELIRADLGGRWHEGRHAYQAFAAAVAQRLAGYEPPTSRGGVLPAGASDLLFPPEQLETIGRTHERSDQRAHSYEHLKAAQQRNEQARAAGMARHMRKKGDDND